MLKLLSPVSIDFLMWELETLPFPNPPCPPPASEPMSPLFCLYPAWEAHHEHENNTPSTPYLSSIWVSKPTHSSTWHEWIYFVWCSRWTSKRAHLSFMFAEPLLIHPQVCLAGVFQTVGSADPQKVYFNLLVQTASSGLGSSICTEALQNSHPITSWTQWPLDKPPQETERWAAPHPRECRTVRGVAHAPLNIWG